MSNHSNQRPRATPPAAATTAPVVAPAVPAGVTFRMVDEVTYPSDPSPELLQRLLNGDPVPEEDRKNKTVAPGKTASDIPPVTIPGLLAGGHIEPANEAAAIQCIREGWTWGGEAVRRGWLTADAALRSGAVSRADLVRDGVLDATETPTTPDEETTDG